MSTVIPPAALLPLLPVRQESEAPPLPVITSEGPTGPNRGISRSEREFRAKHSPEKSGDPSTRFRFRPGGFAVTRRSLGMTA